MPMLHQLRELKNNKSRYQYILLILMFPTLIFCSGSKQTIDYKACGFFESNILLVKNYHEQKEVDGNKLEVARIFLEKTTQIESEADFGFDGAYPPTENDLKKWETWYKENKHLLYWDDQEQKVKVKKE